MKRVVQLAICLAALSLTQVPALSQTTGSITVTIRDQTGAVIAGAAVTVANKATSETRTATTVSPGSYSAKALPPGRYQVTVEARDFATRIYDDVQVSLTETALLNVDLALESVTESITVPAATPMIQKDQPQLGRVVDPRSVAELPLATRNFSQILALSPGASVPLPDHATVGHNSQNISVNGARVNQNSYLFNGVDAGNWVAQTAGRIALPAPESIQEFKVNTSLYDAALGRFAGGNVQMVTKSGSNELHGAVYAYLQNDALNANNPFLKAAGVRRPTLRRNVLGGMAGGPVRKNQAFFFLSYQTTRETNGASDSSLSSSILIAPGLTDDRSEQTLLKTFQRSSIDPISLKLLNAKLPNGQFLIPTPQTDGYYSGSAPSSFFEDQFNTNIDYRLSERNSLTAKFFFSGAGSNLSLTGANNVPGFGADQEYGNRLATLQDVHVFGSLVINDARIGYNYIRVDSFPQEPLRDTDFGIRRSTASAKPGLPLIRIATDARGVAFGTGPSVDTQRTNPSATAADTVSITHGKHSIRTGGEFRYYRQPITAHQNNFGQINFNSFGDFLAGTTSSSVLGTGIEERDWRAADYNVFVQEDWKVRSDLTLNFGLRYDLDLPPYDTKGRVATFDPALYKARPNVVNGPPIGGFVQAGNVIAQYDLPDVPNVTKRVVKSIDPNNFGPRFGFAYAPLKSDRTVVRAGYGVFYSRASAFNLNSGIQVPPNYVLSRDDNPKSFADPFPDVPSPEQFPKFVPGIALSSQVFDRNLRTPYLHEYSASVQNAPATNLLVEAAYVGTRGLNLFRVVRINQARLASPQQPIINEVTGEVITTNTSGNNAQFRAPFQGVSTVNFGLNQTTAQSSYNSLQMSLTKRLSKGLQFLASYTYSKSIDNTAAGSTASAQDAANDVAPIIGNQFDNRANRGPSNFDQTHRLVFSYLWDLPQPAFAAQSRAGEWLLGGWEVAGIVVAASGMPIDVVDTKAGSFYGLDQGGARPNYVPGIDPRNNAPAGYFFNPFAFARPFVQPGQPIPSSGGTAIAGERGTDIGTIGRNTLRGPRQANIDFSVIKRIRFGEGKTAEFHCEFFNMLNQVNLANPISNLNAENNVDSNTGRVANAGNFGRITSTSNNPRLVQIALKIGF